jgi:isopenicillin N synthase-like dioxygenase
MAKPIDAPQPLQDAQEFVKHTMASLNGMGQTIFSALSETLGLTGRDTFEFSHRPGVASTTALGLLKYEQYQAETSQNVGHIAHTDAGSLSMVWSHVGGLQVLLPDTDEWTFIAPRPGMAVVNVGDSLQVLSPGLLRSSLHRVVPHPKESERNKYTIVYLMRPEEEAQITDRDGKVWRAIDWTNKKFSVFRAPIEEQKKGSFLTGRDGYLGLWGGESKGSGNRPVQVEI